MNINFIRGFSCLSVFAIGFFLAVVNAHAFPSARNFIKVCTSEDKIEIGYCYGYIDAVRQMDFELDYWVDRKKEIDGITANDVFPRNCMSVDKENWEEAKKIVVEWIKENELLAKRQSVYTMVMSALSEAYPCKNSESVRILKYKWDEEIKLNSEK